MSGPQVGLAGQQKHDEQSTHEQDRAGDVDPCSASFGCGRNGEPRGQERGPGDEQPEAVGDAYATNLGEEAGERIADASLSQQVRALERELGAPLFHRTRGMCR